MQEPYLTMLATDEGKRLKVYDDATGKPIGPGTHVVGHPTIGIGRALDTNGITVNEMNMLFADDIQTVEPKLQNSFGFYNDLTEGRKYVLCSMAFQLGWAGLLAFHDMLSNIRAGEYDDAADAMQNSHWYTQTPERVKELMQIMKDGDVS